MRYHVVALKAVGCAALLSLALGAFDHGSMPLPRPAEAQTAQPSGRQVVQVAALAARGMLGLFFPTFYLTQALEIMQAGAVDRRTIDWPALREDALTHVTDAPGVAGVYLAIRVAVQRLGDHHSSFLTPEVTRGLAQSSSRGFGVTVVPRDNVVGVVFPGGPADLTGVRVGDTVLRDTMGAGRLVVRHPGATDDITLSTPAEFSTYLPPDTARLGAVGYLRLPGFIGSSEKAHAYAQAARDGIKALDTHPPCGWVVDLRTNTGGNGYPMLTAVAPIIGDGEVGAFVGPDYRTAWALRAGEFYINGADVDLLPGQAYLLRRPNPPVAVLTSRLTGSSGEWVAVAFRGRPETRTFGEATAGVPTANATWKFADGAWLNLTTSRDADRTGQTYDSPLPVDEPVAADWASFGTDRDPVLNAALAWLKTQPGCGE